MNPSLEQALTGLMLAATAVLLPLAGVIGVWVKNRWWDVPKVQHGRLERRSNGGEGTCMMRNGKMPDSAMPPAAINRYMAQEAFEQDSREFHRENIKALDRIAHTLERIDDKQDTVHTALVRLLERRP